MACAASAAASQRGGKCHRRAGVACGLLAASGARIVDGPNEAGAYVLAVPPARLGGVRDALRSAPGVVMVEALPGPTESAP